MATWTTVSSRHHSDERNEEASVDRMRHFTQSGTRFGSKDVPLTLDLQRIVAQQLFLFEQLVQFTKKKSCNPRFNCMIELKYCDAVPQLRFSFDDAFGRFIYTDRYFNSPAFTDHKQGLVRLSVLEEVLTKLLSSPCYHRDEEVQQLRAERITFAKRRRCQYYGEIFDAAVTLTDSDLI